MSQYFKISGDYIELNKLLKASGLCNTGGQAKMIIKDGLVLVNGEIETRIRRKLKHGMIIKYNTQSLKVVCKKK
ncbi:MAG: RNA-binding S4 domain-containing protein [Desulfobacula sp.]|nr:RNA-binding S4 domain-containing protein [Desulfobacula sp.]